MRYRAVRLQMYSVETDQVGKVVGEGGDILGHDEQVPVSPEQRHGGSHQGVVVLRRVRGAPPVHVQGQLCTQLG